MTKKLKIAVLTPEYPALRGCGGIGTYAYYLAQGLTELGHQVTVLTVNYRQGLEKLHDKKVKVIAYLPDTFGYKFFTFHLNTPLKLLNKLAGLFLVPRINVANAWYFYKLFAKLQKKEKFDFVESAECYALSYFIQKRMNNIPVMIRCHTPYKYICYYNKGYITPDMLLENIFEKGVVRTANIVTSPSQAMADILERDYGLKSKINVYPNGIELPAKPVQTTQKGIKVFFANRFQKHKGINLVVNALPALLKKHQDVQYYFAGADDQGVAGVLKKIFQAQDQLKNFHYLGHLTHDAVLAKQREMDIFLQPSSNFENFPYSTMEAMLSGTAVVASRVGGIPEMVGNSGVLFQNNSAESFIKALESLLNNRPKLEKLKKLAFQRACQKFSHIVMAEKTVALFNKY